MKSRTFLIVLLLAFIAELAVILFFTLPKADNLQDTVAVNEAVQSVQNDWEDLDKHINRTPLDYVALSLDGTVLYRTKPGLSETINAAISHRDTILDIEAGGAVAGKLIVYNNNDTLFQSEKQTVVIAVASMMLFQCIICVGYFLYMRRTVIKPFHKLKGFAERVADGNLDIPLEMDRQNLFGAFTESFDIMRSELKRARIAEAKANESKKELVAKLSHDIKTPVASIKAASEVGAALSSEEKDRKNYEQIIQKADQINTLVTNLFSATLEELNELTVTPSDLKSEELRSVLENADYLRRAAIPQIPECILFADKLRLQQVFDNIFVNSYKYADTGIDVTASIENNGLKISIEDFGGGVDESELPLIKEKFNRGSNAQNIAGAGLGLYIADYCMKEMHGRLDIENGANGLKVTVRIAFSGTI